MKRLLGSIVGNAVALFATRVVPGIAVTSDPLQLLLAGALFGLFNWLVRGIAVFLSFPLILLSLLSLPFAISLVRRVAATQEPRALNLVLRQTAALHLRFGTLLIAGLLVATLR